MASRLADRIAIARHDHFVGRVREQDLFRSMLTAPEPPFYVLHIIGPGGIGKTSLLYEFAGMCDRRQTAVVYLDARDIEPSPESFLGALQMKMKLTPPLSPLQYFVDQIQRQVLLIDTYELLAPMYRWLRHSFFAELPDHVLTVLAGTEPPSPEWWTDSGWQSICQVLSLQNLSAAETASYLTKRNIPAEHHNLILDFTHGHPLALALLTDLFSQRKQASIDLQSEISPDVIKTLLARLVRKVPGAAHRTALEASAIVRVMTEALLAEMLQVPETEPGAGSSSHELFDWLRGLSFFESTPEGLFPHDLVREVLIADLRWRNPERYAELHRRARAYYATRLQRNGVHSHQRVLLDYVFLHRDNPAVRPFMDWKVAGNAWVDGLKEADKPALQAMVTEHEGKEAAGLAWYWFEQQPDNTVVFRDATSQPAGFLMKLDLHQVNDQHIATDPATRAAWQYLQQHAPLRPGERATLFRFWMARQTYQAVSAVQSLIFISVAQHYLNTPGLAFTFLPCTDPDFWAPIFNYAEVLRIREADFEVSGRHYGMYGHDWRAMPASIWLTILADKEIAVDPHAAASPPIVEPLVILDRPDFEAAIQQALQSFADPDLLMTNPLIRSRLIIDRAGANASQAERVACLQSLLKEAAVLLKNSPRELKFYRALHHSFFQPTPTQEQTAELLDVSLSTFRRHLKAGLVRVTDILWQEEITGAKQ